MCLARITIRHGSCKGEFVDARLVRGRRNRELRRFRKKKWEEGKSERRQGGK